MRSNGRPRPSNGHKVRRRYKKSATQQYPFVIYKRAALAWIVGVALIETYYFYRTIGLLDAELHSSGALPGLNLRNHPSSASLGHRRGESTSGLHEKKAKAFRQKQNNQPRAPPPPKQKLLPKRLITVFGPESSGSTFLATALGVAVGAFAKDGGWVYIPPWAFSKTTKSGCEGSLRRQHTPQGRWQFEPTIGQRATSPDGEWEIQHLSLPWGSYCEEGDSVEIVEALVPEECYRYERDPLMHRKEAEKYWTWRVKDANAKTEEEDVDFGQGMENRTYCNATIDAEVARIRDLCRTETKISPDANGWTCGAKCGRGRYDGYALYPQRFSVNITSHIEWYLARGVDVTVVLSTRDRTIARRGKLAGHCHLEAEGAKEDAVALELMTEALEKYGARGTRRGAKQRAVAVSYEGLMMMQQPYLQEVYRQLGIDSLYTPSFTDGNVKYVMNTTATSDLGERSMKQDLLLLDGRPPKPRIYEPPPPKPSLLPKNVITVFGLESSGTKFLSSALGTATGAFPKEGQWTYLSDVEGWTFHRHNFRRAMSSDGEWEVQHLSLPFGYLCEEAATLDVVEAYVPAGCFRYESDPDMDAAAAEHSWHMKDKSGASSQRNDSVASEQCRNEVHISEGASPWTCGAKCGTGKYSGFALYPKRFFVNVTSHLEWYASRGVEITAILSLRDLTISGKSKLRDHCHLPGLARREDELALKLMQEALQKHGSNAKGSPRAIAVSYEGLMQYKGAYLLDLYHQLGIHSTHLPKFEDGNGKYVAKSEREEVVMKAATDGKKSMQQMHRKKAGAPLHILQQ